MGVSLCGILIALLALAVVAPADVTATKLDGTVAAGQLQDWSAGRDRTGDGRRSDNPFPRANLLSLELLGKRRATRASHSLELVDGSVLPLAEYSRDRQYERPPCCSHRRRPNRRRCPCRSSKVHAVRLQALEADVLPQWQEIRKLGVPSDLIVVVEARRQEPRPPGMRARRSHRNRSRI